MAMYWIYALLVLFVLTQVSSAAKYHIKYFCLCLSYVLLAGLTGVVCVFRPHRYGSSYNIFVPKFIMRAMRLEWLFGMRYNVHNVERLHDCLRPFVVVSNHQSAIDPAIMLHASPNGTAPLAKKILMYIPVFGWVSWLCGTIFINRSKGRSAIEIMHRVGCEMQEKMTSLWIFSEGTRHQRDTVMPFKKGAFHLAIQAQCPIIPVAIGNYRNVIDRHNRKFEGGTIRVYCLQPVPTVGLTAEDVDSLTERVHKIISDRYNEDAKANAHLFADLPPVVSKTD